MKKPSTVFEAIVLECQSAPYTLGVFLTEESAINRLKLCRVDSEPTWLYVLKVENGIVVSRKDVDVQITAEVYASA